MCNTELYLKIYFKNRNCRIPQPFAEQYFQQFTNINCEALLDDKDIWNK